MFAEALPPEARAAFDADTTASLLAMHVASAQAAWPTLAIPVEDLARELAMRLGAAASPAALERCNAADVYLAIGGCRRHPDALAAIDALLRKAVAFAGKQTGAPPDRVAEVMGLVGKLLLVDEPSRVAACRSFSGRSSLLQYVTIIASRELVRLAKRERATETLDDELLDSLAPGADPELSILRRRYHADVDASFRIALQRLDEGTRALLRLRVTDGWPVARIAKLYGISQPTAYRKLEAARDALGAEIRRALAERLQITIDEVDSIVRLVQSRVDLEL